MRIAILALFGGFFLLRSRIEELTTAFFPGNSELIVGVGLMLYGWWRLKKR